MNPVLANYLLVALGGALGSAARYGLNLLFKNAELLSALALHSRDSKTVAVALPWGTLAANVAGSFLIGLFSEWAGSKLPMTQEVRLLLTTGFCGGLTTLSSLLLEMNDFFRDREWIAGSLYLLATLVLPFVALWAGIAIFKGITATGGR